MSAVGELTVNIVGDMTKLSSAFSKASSEVGKFGNSVSGIGSSMTSKVGSALSTVGKAALVTGTAMGVGLVAGGVKATTMFRDFEQAVANAASVTGKTGDAFKQAKENISAVAMELGQKTVFSSADAADAMYNLASAGYDVSTMTSADLVPMLNLASGTQYDLASTTAMLSSTLSQFGLGFDSVNRVVDVFAANCGATQASMEKLSYSMKYVGTIANASGMSIEETNAALGVLYNAGLDGESAGTGLRGVLASLEKPTKATAKMLKEMGVDLNKLNPDTEDLATSMEQLGNQGLTTAQVFQIFGREAAPAALALMNNTDQVRELTKQFQSAGGTAQTLADEQLDTLSGSLEALSGSIENAYISVGQALAPTIREVAGYLDDAMPSIQSFLVGATESLVGFVTRLGKSISHIMTIGSTLIDVFKNVFNSISGGSGGLGDSLADVINGITNRAAGIIIEMAPTIQNAITGIVEFIKNLISALGPTFENLSSMVSSVMGVFGQTSSGISSSVDVIAGAINIISSALAGLVQFVSSTLSIILPVIGSIFSTIVSTVQGYIPTLQNVWNSLGELFARLPAIIGGVVSSLSPVLDVFNSITTAIANFTASVADNGLTGAIEQAFNVDLSGVTSTIDSIKTALAGIDFSEIFNSIVSTLQGIDFAGIFDSIKTTITGFVSDLSPTWDSLKSSFESIKTIVSEVYTDIKPSLDNVIAAFYGFFSSLDSGDVSSIGSTIAGVINTIAGAIAGLLKWLADNPKVVEFALALVAVEVALSAIIPVVLAVSGFIGSLALSIIDIVGILGGAGGLGTVLTTIATTAFPGITTAVGFLASTVFPTLMTVIGAVVSVTLPALSAALGLLLSPVGLVIAGIALLYVAWSKNWLDIQGVTARVVAAIQTSWTKFTAELGRLPGVASTALGTLTGTFSTAFNNIIADIQNWISRQQARYAYAMVQLTGFRAQATQRWAEIKAGILAKLNEIIADAQNWISRQGVKFSTAIAQLSTFKTQTIARWTEIKAGILAKFNAIVSDTQNWVSRQKEKFNNVISAVTDLKLRFIAGFTDILTSIRTKATEIVNSVGEIATKIKNKATDFYNAGKEVVQKLIDGLASKLSDVKKKVSEILDAASLSSSKSLGKSLSTSISNMGKSAKISLTEAESGLKRLIPNSPAKEGPFKELPNWDAIFYTPLSESINKINNLSSPLSSALRNVKNPVDSGISNGLKSVSNVTTSNSYSYGGDTLNLGGVTLSTPLDVNALFDMWEKRIANKRRARGI